MKRKIESLTKSPSELFGAAVEAGDVDHVRQLLESHPDLVSMINEPMFSFKRPAVHVARTNLELLDLLLAHGADINARTSWEKGGFGVLEQVNPDEAAPLIARGARIDIWAAANLDMTAELATLIAGDPALVHAKGGDGKRPLHFARTIQIARFLLEHGAEIDALDDDHDSTPAQHLIGDRTEVAGFLVAQGAHSDLLLHWAAFHGNADMVEEILPYNPPIDAQDRQFDGTAMGWLIHGALNPWGFSTGQHSECAHLLLGAGARVDEASLPTGHDGIDRVLREHFVRS